MPPLLPFLLDTSLVFNPLLIVLVGVLTCAWKVVDWIWLRPKKLEKILIDQGLAGNSYWIYYGDTKENGMLLQQATSRPMKFSHDVAHRVHPLLQENIKTYGKDCFMWFGPTPCVNIMDPALMKTVFTKLDDFYRPSLNPFLKFLVYGLLGNNGDDWAYHRKIINPAFQFEKLKNMILAFYHSCSEVISEWERMAAAEEALELDVFPFMQELTSDAIARTSFGRSHREGIKIFKVVEEQIKLTSKAVQGVFIYHLGSNKNIRMNIGDVIDECTVFYVAGQETTPLDTCRRSFKGHEENHLGY